MAVPLTVESGQAKQCQAQFSRLQHSLGLRKELAENGKLSGLIAKLFILIRVGADSRAEDYGQRLSL